MSETWAERTASRLMNSIPGYTGYKDKESRRDADRVVRDRLAAALANSADRVERVATNLANARRIAEVGAVNDAAGSIRHLRDRIATASYGYGGLFSNRDIDAPVLDQIRLFDESLLSGAGEIDKAAGALEHLAEGGGDLKIGLTAIGAAVSSLSERFHGRNAVIETAIPASAEQMSKVLAVLDSPEQRKAATTSPAAYELHDRDALSVLGDNFVVDARIDVESANDGFRVFRLDVAPEKWLLVPKASAGTFALLTATQAGYSGGSPVTIDEVSYALEASGHGSGEMIGASGQSGRRAVSYTLLRGETETSKRALVLQWGAEQQVLTGSEVKADDIEIFGKPD
jgi:hypothetical protein